MRKKALGNRSSDSFRHGRAALSETSPLVLTVGHSTRSIEEFLRLLHEHEVTCVADVRTIPRSRHNPQFSRDSLPAALKTAGMDYQHFPGLGGLRHTNANSPNKGWRNASFRGYADYMQTPAFEEALAELMRHAKGRRLALMCAEAVPWRCHRSLIADALLVRGCRVEHIMSPTSRQAHTLTPFAKVQGLHLTYPSEERSGSEVDLPGIAPALGRQSNP